MKKIILFLLFINTLIFAGDFSIMSGFKNTNILWDNPGKELMGPKTEPGEDFIRGGSFDVSQPGIDFRIDYYLNEDFTIPLGFDYTFFSAKELIPLNNYIYGRLIHKLHFSGLYTGLYYNIKKYNILDTRIYGGIEIRGSFINNIKYQNYLIFKEIPDLNEYNNLPVKDNAFRLGTTAKLGVDANFNEYFNMNFSFSYTLVNLLNSDDGRGELFTVEKQFETQESLVHMFHISLMLQYNLKNENK
jgi:hypothetical protein